jgi:hypothetical protein
MEAGGGMISSSERLPSRALSSEAVSVSILARAIDSELNRSRLPHQAVEPFVFLLLGPPSIGKTPVQRELFRLWRGLDPRYLRISGFIEERSVRLTRNVSECSAEAYAMPELRTALAKAIRGEEV